MSRSARSRVAGAHQRGFSPVEILVGLVLGLMLVTGVTQLLVGTRASTASERNLQQMQESGRFAIELIGRELRKTGFRFDRVSASEVVFPAAGIYAAGVSIRGDDEALNMRFQSGDDAWSRSCLDDAVAAGALIEQTLSVSDGRLTCRARDTAAGTEQTLALLDNVEALSLTYGVDVDGDGFADEYQAADAVADWLAVVSVNVQLRTVSPDESVADQPQPFVDFDGSVRTPTDRRLRRGYATVIALRNRLP